MAGVCYGPHGRSLQSSLLGISGWMIVYMAMPAARLGSLMIRIYVPCRAPSGIGALWNGT